MISKGFMGEAHELEPILVIVKKKIIIIIIVAF